MVRCATSSSRPGRPRRSRSWPGASSARTSGPWRRRRLRVSGVLLTVLGCSGSASGPRAPSSGYLLEADGFLLGLELGHGVLAELAAVRDPFALDALLFSHLHPDHCADFA